MDQFHRDLDTGPSERARGSTRMGSGAWVSLAAYGSLVQLLVLKG